MKPDKYYIDASSFVEVTGELADFMMQEKLGEKYPLLANDRLQTANNTQKHKST